ncbi:MAG: sigma 54-interacting transcriptional regulator [Desulfobacterales bacterium]
MKLKIFQSLRGKLLLGVSALVIGPSVTISILATHHYSSELRETAVMEAENIAYSIALEATDNILVNDLVALQRTLNHHKNSNASLAYLFIVRNGQIIAHTFDGGYPPSLITANRGLPDSDTRFKKIRSETGEHFIDIAWPILHGRAGVLRLGLTEKPLQDKIRRLWVDMCLFALGVSLPALIGGLFFVRRMIAPLSALAAAAENTDDVHIGVMLRENSSDEVGKLTVSFNRMIARLKEYTEQLELKTMNLDNANREMETFCRIIKQIGGQHSLDGLGSFLMKELQGILGPHAMLLYIYSGDRELLFQLSERGTLAIKEKEQIDHAFHLFSDLEGITISPKDELTPPLLPDFISTEHRQTLIPLRSGEHVDGALLILCPSGCPCERKALELVDLVLEQAAGTLKRAVSHQEEIHDLMSRRERVTEFSGIIGKDTKMQEVFKLIEDVAPTDATVLIQGGSGTGKELAARAIHHHSPRKDNPFVVINCSAYPSTLLESELFGHEKGAFTGAIRQRSGRFEQADTGSVFLDEIAEIPPSAQIKLLRVLQTHKFKRLGGNAILSVDVRIIAATNKDLLQQVKNGEFREDLYYRLNVIPLILPPLKDRPNDIPLLARHFLRIFSTEQGKDIRDISPEAMRRLLEFTWPGNVRELENTIEHTVVLAKGHRIELTDLPSLLLDAPSIHSTGSMGTITENEKNLLINVLEECNWNKKQTAIRLGISRSSLYSKLNKHQITKPTIH